jgi:hypothetical protein
MPMLFKNVIIDENAKRLHQYDIVVPLIRHFGRFLTESFGSEQLLVESRYCATRSDNHVLIKTDLLSRKTVLTVST